MATVLIVSNLRVFNEAGMATGPGLRAWGIATSLAARGHTTSLYQLDFSVATPASTCRDGVALNSWKPGDRALRRALAAADVVIVQPGGDIATELTRVKPRCLVVDLYNPVVPELLTMIGATEPGQREYGGALRWYRSLLQQGDYFLCAGERQRQFTLGVLAHAGRLNPLTDAEDLLRLVPMGVEAAPPVVASGPPLLRGVIVPADAELLLWPGGIYRWFEAVTAIQALARLRIERPRAVMVFVGAENPLDPVASEVGVAEARGAARALGLMNAGVYFTPWLPFAARAAMYHEADLAVLTHRRLLEALLSWRTRSLDCLWGGLPLVVSAGDEVGEIAARAGAAACVPVEDPEALAGILRDLLADPARRAAMAVAARRLANESWTWERVTEPLHQICASPRPALDRAAMARSFGIGAAAEMILPPSLSRRITGRAARLVAAGLRPVLPMLRSLNRWRGERMPLTLAVDE